MVKVSVIVPVYNVEKYLAECLDSIINQTLRDIEIICVNDGSTDNSLKILEIYAKNDSRIKLISKENQGLGAARNTGLNFAKGEYIYFIDSDDYLELCSLEEIYNCSKNNNLDVLMFQLINYDDDKNRFYSTDAYEMPKILNLVEDNIFNYEDLGDSIFKVAVSAVNKLYNREFINKFNLKFPEGVIFEDNLFFWEMLFNAKRMLFVPKKYYIRRRHSASITGHENKNFVDTLKIHNEIIGIFKKFNLFDKFKSELFNKKINASNTRFGQVGKYDKNFFYDNMKIDFQNMIEEYGYEYIISYLNNKNRVIFNNVINSNSIDEFILLMDNFNYENNAKKLTRRNKTLQNKINLIKKENNILLSSNSWKLTKPLRSIKNHSFKENLLKKSNSYVYYKQGYEKVINKNKRLNNTNNKLQNENNTLKKEMKLLQDENKRLLMNYTSIDNKLNNLQLLFEKSEKCDEFLDFFNDKINKINDNFVKRDNFNKNIYKELQYAFVFNDTIKGSEWLDKFDFSLINSAANYSLVYVLYRVLNDVKPKNIMEMGLGQTTKLTSQYSNYFKDSNLIVLEGDQTWIEIFSNNLKITENIEILNMDLEIIEHDNSPILRFKDVKNHIKNQKFDLIIIDGPQGFITDNNNRSIPLKYSRTNIWELIPDYLNDDFVIIIDDYDRIGEQNTVEHIKELLTENNIEFSEHTIWAYKKQHLIFTKKYEYVGWI